MFGTYVAVIVVTLLAVAAILAIIALNDELRRRRQAAMIDAIKYDLVPAMYDEMMKCMPKMMEQVAEASMKMTKKMMNEDWDK